jgi:hypothetical protein
MSTPKENAFYRKCCRRRCHEVPPLMLNARPRLPAVPFCCERRKPYVSAGTDARYPNLEGTPSWSDSRTRSRNDELN